MMPKLTLKKIRNFKYKYITETHNAKVVLKILLKSFNKIIADNAEVPIGHLLEFIGIQDTLWVIYEVIEGELDKKRNMHIELTETAIRYAESVLHIFENIHPDDGRVKKIIEAAKKCFNNINNDECTYNDSALQAIYFNLLTCRSLENIKSDDAKNTVIAAKNAAWIAASRCYTLMGYYRTPKISEEKYQKQIIFKYFGDY